MKTCFKCGKEKFLSDFYKHPQMGDGHLNKCIECAKKDVAERISKKEKDLEWLAGERERCRKKQIRYRKLGLARQSSRDAVERWRVQNRIKVNAELAARRAVKSGKIKVKEACEDCSATGPLQKHHEDYSKPLVVVFLCTKCHGIRHRKTGPIKKRK